MSITAMKQALEALEWEDCNDDNGLELAQRKAITSLHEAIEQAEQAQPVMWMMRSGHGTHYRESLPSEMQALTFAGKPMWVPLYTAPPPYQNLFDDRVHHATLAVSEASFGETK